MVFPGCRRFSREKVDCGNHLKGKISSMERVFAQWMFRFERKQLYCFVSYQTTCTTISDSRTPPSASLLPFLPHTFRNLLHLSQVDNAPPLPRQAIKNKPELLNTIPPPIMHNNYPSRSNHTEHMPTIPPRTLNLCIMW